MSQIDLFEGEPPAGPRFACFLSDPPWPEKGAGKIKRGADRHYPVVPVKDIPDLIRSSGLHTPAEHAHHWMWVTDNYLPDALWVLDVLGWRYVRTAVWVKSADPVAVVGAFVDIISDRFLAPLGTRPVEEFVSLAAQLLAELKVQIGLGQYLRGSHELLLFAVRGKGQHPSVRTDDRSRSSVIYGRRTKHSRKPESAYELIESISQGPRVELFARSDRDGWTSWGNEISPNTGAEP